MGHRRRLSAARAAEIRRRINRPPAHWSLLAFVGIALVLLLAVYGLAGEWVGRSRTPSVQGHSPLAGAEPVLVEGKGRLLPRALHPRRVALTFDDGPDPKWTPRIAAELRRLHAPATFFVVGSHVVSHPGIVRDLWRQGFELGNHTFTHGDLFATPAAGKPPDRLDRERNRRRRGRAAAAIPAAVLLDARRGRRSEQERTLARSPATGYVIVLSDRDGRDWERGRSPAAIARSATAARRGRM